jgi:multidrug resistance efflux pump
MLTTSLLLALALSADPKPADAGEPQIPVCQVVSINDQAVPGTDPGVLMTLNVKEGMIVTKDMEIGRIDDSTARADLEVKQYEYETANQKATSSVNIRHAKAAKAVATVAVQRLKLSNDKFKGTVTDIDIKKAELEEIKAELAIEQVMEEQIEAQLAAKAKKAAVGAANVALGRHVLRAPFDGVVVKIDKRPGEWVASGEPVIHIVGINRLRVSGNLDTTAWGPADIQGRNVTVEVPLPRGRTVRVPGRVTYVSPVVALGYQAVWAEIDTPMEDGLPVVRAGSQAAMTVHVNQPVATTPAVPTRPASAPPTVKKK